MKTNSAIPIVLIVAVVCVIIFAFGGFIIYDRSISDSPSDAISEFEAERIHEITETGTPPKPPFAESERGVVTESTDKVIRLKGLVGERSWPIADDAEVWKDGQKISSSAIKSGETVDLQVQKLGSRQDGWISTVIRINVDSVADVSAADEQIPDAAMAETEPDREIAPSRPREVYFSGTVIEADDRTIKIRDSLGDELSYAVDETATVRRGDDVGSVAILQEGDHVSLVGQRVGNRASGQTVMIDRISVQ